jgi:hypothetical protein
MVHRARPSHLGAALPSPGSPAAPAFKDSVSSSLRSVAHLAEHNCSHVRRELFESLYINDLSLATMRQTAI